VSNQIKSNLYSVNNNNNNNVYLVVPIQRQRRRGIHTVHKERLQQFRRHSTVTESIGQTVHAVQQQQRNGRQKDVFILTTSII